MARSTEVQIVLACRTSFSHSDDAGELASIRRGGPEARHPSCPRPALGCGNPCRDGTNNKGGTASGDRSASGVHCFLPRDPLRGGILHRRRMTPLPAHRGLRLPRMKWRPEPIDRRPSVRHFRGSEARPASVRTNQRSDGAGPTSENSHRRPWCWLLSQL